MGSVCPACGQTSRDSEFCDHCNRDLHGPPAAPAIPSSCPVFVSAPGDGKPSSVVELTPEQQAVVARPDASLLVNADGQWQRVHWISRDVLPLWSARLRQRLAKNSLCCLPRARLVEEATGAWMLVDATPPLAAPDGSAAFQPWASAVENPQEECERLLRFVGLLAEGLEEMHAHGLVWLTFDPQHLEQNGPDQLRFTNLDLVVYPAGQCPERLHLKTSFAAPEIMRYHPEDISPRTDVFHLALFAYYWLAGLLPDGFPGEGLDTIWYQMPKLRVYARDLPPGIAGVLARGMAREPSLRYGTPKALAAALQAAVQGNRQRLDFHGKLCWDIGADTRTGRTKAALGKENEDRILVRPFSANGLPDRALLAVADGITTCAVGSGALASLIVTIVLENAFDAGSTQETFQARIAEVCRTGAQTLLAWALEKGYRQQLEEGDDLMGTTLTAGWLEGNVLSLANLGDSRAYLVTGAGNQELGGSSAESAALDLGPDTNVEQLTVDGDLATGMLVEGMAPETIRDVGPIGKALRECIGGCTFDATGKITILEECCHPVVSQWHLLPGDVIVLCSDGLVEEGAFLEPEFLGKIVRSNPRLSAQDLSRRLVEAAEELHRLPTPLEPEGFGDNISCIVVKIEQES